MLVGALRLGSIVQWEQVKAYSSLGLAIPPTVFIAAF
jgi:hypothetical protein